MIKLTAEQMTLIEQTCFFYNIEKFISAYCNNEKMAALISDKERLHQLWGAAWSSGKALNQHDSTLFFVILAVCEAEGVAIKSAEAMAFYVKNDEIKAKQFLTEREYFKSSDFELLRTEVG